MQWWVLGNPYICFLRCREMDAEFPNRTQRVVFSEAVPTIPPSFASQNPPPFTQGRRLTFVRHLSNRISRCRKRVQNEQTDPEAVHRYCKRGGLLIATSIFNQILLSYEISPYYSKDTSPTTSSPPLLVLRRRL